MGPVVCSCDKVLREVGMVSDLFSWQLCKINRRFQKRSLHILLLFPIGIKVPAGESL